MKPPCLNCEGELAWFTEHAESQRFESERLFPRQGMRSGTTAIIAFLGEVLVTPLQILMSSPVVEDMGNTEFRPQEER